MGNAEICSRLLHFNKRKFEPTATVNVSVFYTQLCKVYIHLCLQIKCLNVNETSVCKTDDGENVFAENNTDFRTTNSI